MPFAIIGSTNVVEVNGRKTRGRVYPWGVIDIQDESYSDFVKLKSFLRYCCITFKSATLS